MKYEWRKQEKSLYFPKDIEIRRVSSQSFLILDGQGDPNEPKFGQQVEALYTVSYAIRMMLKKGSYTEPYEYTVYPLEGVWTTSDGSKNKNLNKNALVYRIMIRQPDLVNQEIVMKAIETTKAKKDNVYLEKIQFETYEDDLVIQAIHKGSFETEQETFLKMESVLEQSDFERDWIMSNYVHREIYLSDARRVAPDKRKTLLRYKLKKEVNL